MPITPNEAADRQNNSHEQKLFDHIDRSLSLGERSISIRGFEYGSTQRAIVKWQSLGWDVSFDDSDEYVLNFKEVLHG